MLCKRALQHIKTCKARLQHIKMTCFATKQKRAEQKRALQHIKMLCRARTFKARTKAGTFNNPKHGHSITHLDILMTY